MKKIFTLLFAAGIVTAALAQTGSRDNRDSRQNDQRNDQNGYDYGKDNAAKNYPFDKDDRYNNGRYSSERYRDMQIAQINREYDFKIQRIRNSFFMSRWEKQRQIRFLEEQRQHEIRMVYARFSKNRNRHHDRDDHSNRRY
jgi:hypothetical protein